VSSFRIREAADLLGVSDDTVRRWADAGRLPTVTSGGRRTIDGAVLARFSEELNRHDERSEQPPVVRESARNRMRGLVTRVVRDTVMAQVEIQAGPFRIVSLMSREAADELGLEPGSLAVAAVKATNVVVEVPGRPDTSA
jgi:molybdopterin-binding protein